MVLETGLATYPNVTVVCGPTESDPEGRTAVTNPTVVVEVTSDSSEHYDRGPKRDHYQTIPSLKAVVVVSHRERLVEVWTRSEGGWSHAVAREGERAAIAAIDTSINVDVLYAAAQEPTS
ncbi:MAG TPA: Uma2 family endonuclease [Polyangiaceae bacterium]|jgi:Uma2 family endonuclease|nr:Uma2 family endonuclease [Polyangiaceae bacterium]